MKIELVSDWRTIHKRWSTWLTIIGSTLSGWVILIPDNAYAAWLALPDEVRHILPEQYLKLIGAMICLSAIGAKYIRQHKLSDAAASPRKE